MRRLMLVAVLCIGFSTTAHASQFSDGIGRVWGYATSPVNCVGNLLSDLVGAGTKFVVCFLGNMNPSNLIP